MLLAPAATLLALLAALAWLPWLLNRWRFRRIPGPFAPPVLGNLLGVARHELHGFLDLCRRRHGPLFKFYIGSSMIVVVAEPTLARRVFSRELCRHAGVQLVAGEEDWDFLTDGLVGANGPLWRSLRAAWTPAFGAAALEGYAPAVNAGADELARHLEAPAASGEAVDLFELLGAVLLRVLGEAAYGIDLQSAAVQQPGGAGAQPQGGDQQLLRAVREVFDGGGVANSSSYLPLILLFPALAPLVRALAFHWPDAKLRRLAQARRAIRRVSLKLVHSWRRTAAPPGGSGSAPPPPLPAQGTFPSLMLAARDKETGEQLPDEQVVAQFNAFLVAAFETSAAAVAFCVYFVARHPEAQARLLEEVDSIGRGRPVTTADLGRLPYVDAVVKESLRLLPPGTIATRSTEQPLQLAPGVLLPPGTPLFAAIYCIHRDPELWPEAEKFLPERWLQEGAALRPSNPDAYAPFGYGPRLCVGAKLAQLEVAVMLVRLFQQFTFELLPGQLPLPVKQTFALVPSMGLRVRARRRR